MMPLLGPGHWRTQPHHVLLNTDWAQGAHFLATWAAWRANAQQPQRPERLSYVAICPPAALTPQAWQDALAHSPEPTLAAQLVAARPPATPDLHVLSFDGGAVRLLLAVGSVTHWLSQLQLSAHSLLLGSGGDDAERSRVYSACARLSAPGAQVVCVDTDAARRGLRTAGFVCQPQAGLLNGQRPSLGDPGYRALAPAPPGRRPANVGRRHALVIGAGLAGAAAAQALARQGLAVTVLEQAGEAAQGASGNVAGLFHSVVHAQDGAHALLLRAAAVYAARHYPALLAAGARGSVGGLLRGLQEERTGPMDGAGLASLQAMLVQLGLPPEHMQAVDATTASALAGVPLPQRAWYGPQGGWMNPPSVVKAWLAQAGVTLMPRAKVHALARCPQNQAWQARDADGKVMAEAEVVVVANAQGCASLLAPWSDAAAWPLENTRGQISHVPASLCEAWQLPRPRMPVASGAYALSLPDDLGGGLLCGATKQWDDADPHVRDDDHRQNLGQLQELIGWSAPASSDLKAVGGRVGWRLATNDRLPVVGPVAAPLLDGQRPLDQPRHISRVPGLYVCGALGARGLTLAPLLGEVLAAWVTGGPIPLPSRVLDAIDPARFMARRQRQGL